MIVRLSLSVRHHISFHTQRALFERFGLLFAFVASDALWLLTIDILTIILLQFSLPLLTLSRTICQ